MHLKNDYLQEGNLIQLAHKYKYLTGKKLLNRAETIVHRSISKTIQTLQKDNPELKAKIWVARSLPHRREDARYLDGIARHIDCQEKLIWENHELKTSIALLERQLLVVDRELYELNRKTVPDGQHLEHTAKIRKQYAMIMNTLDANVKRECTWSASNAILRRRIIDLLNQRGVFNEQWHKLIIQLRSGQNYLNDLVDMAEMVLNRSIEVHEKANACKVREARDLELRKVELQEAVRLGGQLDAEMQFLDTKLKSRQLDDLEPREYKRRDIFRLQHGDKIKIFKVLLKSYQNYYGHNLPIADVIKRFKEHECNYYSYFNYTTELGLHLTNLNNRIDVLYKCITDLQKDNQTKYDTDTNRISELQFKLKMETHRTKSNATKQEKLDGKIEKLLKGIHTIVVTIQADQSALCHLLGDHSTVTIFNMKKFLKIFEFRLNEIIARVYIAQRRERRRHYLIADVAKYHDQPTELNDIVVSSQCPECVATQELNPYDTRFVQPDSPGETRERLRDIVMQPELMYRMHSLKHCRLPSSRGLAVKSLDTNKT